jgi:hypothetical protein
MRAIFNGVDRKTGGYLFAPEDLEMIAASLPSDPPSGQLQDGLIRRHRAEEDDLEVMFGFDPENLASVGWGVVTAPDVDPAVQAALEPLLTLREGGAGERFHRLEYRPGEDADAWLDRHGVAAPQRVDPRQGVPYYLLLVGDPATIPYEYQYELGLNYAVGRIHFDTAEEYSSYGASVLSAEAVSSPPHGHIFGTRNPADEATALSSELLVTPMLKDLQQLSTDSLLTEDIGGTAKRSRLAELLVTDDAPSVLFTASHGLGDSGTANRETQGALVCQDWPGPLLGGPVTEDQYLAGRHIDRSRPIRPNVIVTFACYGAGTPATSDFDGLQLAPEPFVARLPQCLLGNPSGGALAYVGHIDRALGYSFMWTGVGSQVSAMSGMMLALLSGKRLGSAMEEVTSTFGSVAAILAQRINQRLRFCRTIDAHTLLGLWSAYYDARNYVILGDPAVRAVQKLPPGRT